LNTVEKINPRQERPNRRRNHPAHAGKTRREPLEIKEQDILRTERMRKNRPHRQFGKMENRGRARHQHNGMTAPEHPRRHFGWRTEEHIYREGEVPFTYAGFRQHTNRPLHRHEHRWQARPQWAKSDNPEGRAKHRWAMRPRHDGEFRREGGEFRGQRIRDDLHQAQPGQQHRRWAMRPRHADEYRREGGVFRGQSIRDNLHQAQPSQQYRRWAMRPRNADEFRREGGVFRGQSIRDNLHQAQPSQQYRRWAMRPRHADEYHCEGGEFRGQRIREHTHQTQYAQHQHPRHILREKWMLEQKLFRITRRIQRLNHQLRG